MNAPILCLMLAAGLTLAACAGGAEAPAGEPAPAIPAAVAAEPALPLVTVYKSPTCGCCSAWVDHLRGSGFRVEAVDVQDTRAIKRQYGIPDALASCHTAVVDGYVVEGHVPADDVRRLLAERPEAGGLAVPGMPVGSPGMEAPDGRTEPYAVLLVDDGGTSVYARH